MLIVGESSLSRLLSKNSSNPKAIPMSLSAVPSAVKQERRRVMGIVAPDISLDARCIQRYVLSVGKKLKYHSSLAKVDQYIAANATIRSEQTSNNSYL